MDVLAVAEQAKTRGEGTDVEQVLAVCLRDSLATAFGRDAEAAHNEADSGVWACCEQHGIYSQGDMHFVWASRAQSRFGVFDETVAVHYGHADAKL